MSEKIQIKRALISVSDKTGVSEFARELASLGVEICSTGGTAAKLRDEGIDVVDVSSITGYPEIMGGRVKTLHPRIHGGLLALRTNAEHMRELKETDGVAIDLLVANLYPFEATVAGGGTPKDCIENIDIGGPAMIRAAAKNHQHVVVATDPEDYAPIIKELKGAGDVSGKIRQSLALKAFALTSYYDSAVSAWFRSQSGEKFPKNFTLGGRLHSKLRYGENPHQEAAFYAYGDAPGGLASAQLVQGKALSYNNINDADAAVQLIAEFSNDDPTVAIIKHANPCGVASAQTGVDAYEYALRCDSVSAFGGIVTTNCKLDRTLAEKITEIFTEVVIAPGADSDAISVFAQKKNLRLLLLNELPDPNIRGTAIQQVSSGFLLQDRDFCTVDEATLKVVTKRAPSIQEMSDLLFANKVAKHVKSNAIVYVKNKATVGIGAGQMSRLDSSRIAAQKSQDAADKSGAADTLAKGSVVASDAFFPFADGLLAAAAAGATAVIQPGGSIRDDDVIAAADDAGLAMVFTGVRHFRH
ncbi:MAG: bifunctional phosphoribosylaminoimidazolecarboxamide formyltransferase/IMP cyclohydrolase [Marinicaulis sp.]|nr:bifunctional phosphoribosylaminoimidazolecarboxamide formyltransferase/IMP cyclohydrolase [Marinicaulis sp.]NNL89747.1 bifunctional phosphoribosylaminoimidazolecarboxamide formyltransferase/IMP cyclohydrolase [Marinicaulis sp.]